MHKKRGNQTKMTYLALKSVSIFVVFAIEGLPPIAVGLTIADELAGPVEVGFGLGTDGGGADVTAPISAGGGGAGGGVPLTIASRWGGRTGPWKSDQNFVTVHKKATVFSPNQS